MLKLQGIQIKLIEAMKTPAHRELSDKTFLFQLETTTIDPHIFTHEAHIRFGYLCLKEYHFDEAVKTVKKAITSLDNKFGDGTKYHETITIIFLYMIKSKMNAFQGKNWLEFINSFPELIDAYKPLMLKHYSSELLFSDEARIRYIQPDLLSFEILDKRKG